MEPQYMIDSDVPSFMNAQEYEYLEVQSDNANVLNDDQFRFELKDTNSLTNLSRAYLEVRLAIEKTDGTAYVATDNVALNGSVGTLFSRAVLRLNNMVVESTDQCHVVNSLKPLLLYSKDYSSSSSTNELFYLHTGENLDTTLTSHKNVTALTGDGTQGAGSILIEEDAGYNEGHKRLRDRLSASAEVSAILPLECLVDFASVDKIITNLNVALELTRSDRNYHMFRSGAVDGRVSVKRASLWVPRIQAQPSLEMELKSAFSSGIVSNFRFKKWNGYLPTALAGGGTFSTRIATMSERVVGVFVMAKPSAITQTVNSNKTVDVLTDLYVRINGKQYPQQAYSNLKLTQGKTRAFLNLLDYQSRGSDVSSGIQLDRVNWENQSVYYVNTEAMIANDSKSPSTVEINCSTDGACQLHCVIVSEKVVSVNYTGQQPQVSVF
jgi:hypothetical protein